MACTNIPITTLYLTWFYESPPSNLYQLYHLFSFSYQSFRRWCFWVIHNQMTANSRILWDQILCQVDIYCIEVVYIYFRIPCAVNGIKSSLHQKSLPFFKSKFVRYKSLLWPLRCIIIYNDKNKLFYNRDQNIQPIMWCLFMECLTCSSIIFLM